MNFKGFGVRKQGKLALIILTTVVGVLGGATTTHSQIPNLQKAGAENKPTITSRKWAKVRQIKVLKSHKAVVNAIVFSPDSKVAIAGGG